MAHAMSQAARGAAKGGASGRRSGADAEDDSTASEFDDGDLLRALADFIDDGVLVHDHLGRVLMHNDRAVALLGVDATRFSLGLEFDADCRFLREDGSVVLRKDWPGMIALRSGHPVAATTLGVQKADEAPSWLSIRARAVLRTEDGRPPMALVTLTDQEELKRARAELAGAVERERLATEQLRNVQIRTDTLTGLPNELPLTERLEQLMAEGGRGRRFAVVMLEADQTDQLADVHGTAVADEVLRRLAEILRRAIRRTDMVARTGPQRFCVLLADLNPRVAVSVAEKLRRAVAGITLPQAITASVGVACFQGLHVSAQALLSAAQGALQRAQEYGRNRVEIAV